jgi:hypothetical protein
VATPAPYRRIQRCGTTRRLLAAVSEEALPRPGFVSAGAATRQEHSRYLRAAGTRTRLSLWKPTATSVAVLTTILM